MIFVVEVCCLVEDGSREERCQHPEMKMAESLRGSSCFVSSKQRAADIPREQMFVSCEEIVAEARHFSFVALRCVGPCAVARA